MKTVRFWKNLVRQNRTILQPYFGCGMHIKGRDNPKFQCFCSLIKIWKWPEFEKNWQWISWDCKLKHRVWPHAHLSRLRHKIFFTPKNLRVQAKVLDIGDWNFCLEFESSPRVWTEDPARTSDSFRITPIQTHSMPIGHLRVVVRILPIFVFLFLCPKR